MADLGHERAARTDRPDSVNDSLLCKIVPKEPTDGMIDAGLAVMAAWHDLPGSAATVNREKMRRRWIAMVEAAPVFGWDEVVTESGGKEQTNSRDTNVSTDGTNG
jgi:hypothetical protein